MNERNTMTKKTKPTYILFAEEYACDDCWFNVEVMRGTKIECEMARDYSHDQYRNFEIVSVKEYEEHMSEIEGYREEVENQLNT